MNEGIGRPSTMRAGKHVSPRLDRPSISRTPHCSMLVSVRGTDFRLRNTNIPWRRVLHTYVKSHGLATLRAISQLQQPRSRLQAYATTINDWSGPREDGDFDVHLHIKPTHSISAIWEDLFHFSATSGEQPGLA